MAVRPHPGLQQWRDVGGRFTTFRPIAAAQHVASSMECELIASPWNWMPNPAASLNCVAWRVTVTDFAEKRVQRRQMRQVTVACRAKSAAAQVAPECRRGSTSRVGGRCRNLAWSLHSCRRTTVSSRPQTASGRCPGRSSSRRETPQPHALHAKGCSCTVSLAFTAPGARDELAAARSRPAGLSVSSPLILLAPGQRCRRPLQARAAPARDSPCRPACGRLPRAGT